jgi:two-component system, cell cycle response regulator CtrA
MLAMKFTDENVSRRRAEVHRAQGQSVITIGKLSIKLDTKTVEVDGGRIDVTGSEYHMLELLALRRGTCVTRAAFMDYLYGATNAPKPKILDIFICKLRRKLSGAADVDKCIETVWGRGYLLNDRVSEGAARIWALQPAVEGLRSGNP